MFIGVSLSYSVFPSNPAHLLSPHVGRVLAADVGSSEHSFAGQCVAIHSHLLLTAYHCCFDAQTGAELSILVGLKASIDNSLFQLFPATIMRCSGKMDVAVLQLSSSIASPFEPISIASSAALNYYTSNTECSLVSFSVVDDSIALRTVTNERNPELIVVEASLLDHLPSIPYFQPSTVIGTRKRKYGNRIPRQDHLIGISTYPNEKGVSGGAVVGMENGKVVLLGIHTHNQRLGSDETLKYMAASVQGKEWDGINSTDQDVEMSIETTTQNATNSDTTNSHGSAPESSSPALPGPKSTEKIRDKLDFVAGAVASKSVFAVASSVLRGRWALDELLQELQQQQVTSSSSTSSSSSASSPSTTSTLRRSTRVRVPSARPSPSAPPRHSPSNPPTSSLYDHSDSE